MARQKKADVQTKRKETLDAHTEKKKRELVDQLRRTPIVQIACEKTDVGRSTYYQWRKVDGTFARAADKALRAGEFFINDIAESKLISLVQGGNLTAIIFWLKHNHPKYAVTTRFIHQYELVSDSPSVEEVTRGESVMFDVVYRPKIKAFAEAVTPKAKELKEIIEAELEEAERNEPERKRRDSFEEPHAGDNPS